jgi:hypothetical protein
MSAYIQLMTPMVDEDCLCAALSDLGFKDSAIERHASPIALRGFTGHTPEHAHLVLRGHLAHSSADIGFLKTSTGYRAIVNDIDLAQFGEKWLTKLNQNYQAQLAAKLERIAEEERQLLEKQRRQLVEAQRTSVYERAKKMGYTVKESREGDSIRLVLVKRIY